MSEHHVYRCVICHELIKDGQKIDIMPDGLAHSSHKPTLRVDRELELYEDLAALASNVLMRPHLLRVMLAARRREPELEAAWRRFERQLTTTPQDL